jgi:cytochrome c oxidase subunit 3
MSTTREWSVTGDMSQLPDAAIGSDSLGWWGTVGFMLIEGTAFVLAAGAYFYLMPLLPAWPPSSPPPDWRYGTMFVALSLLSEWPNARASRAAAHQDARGVRLWLSVTTLCGLLLMVIRGFEFTALNEHWTHNAYGSMLWALMFIHTVHVATDVWDSVVLNVLVFVHPLDLRRCGDVSDNAMYWHFVVVSWLAIYTLVYLVPRFGHGA